MYFFCEDIYADFKVQRHLATAADQFSICAGGKFALASIINRSLSPELVHSQPQQFITKPLQSSSKYESSLVQTWWQDKKTKSRLKKKNSEEENEITFISTGSIFPSFHARWISRDIYNSDIFDIWIAVICFWINISFLYQCSIPRKPNRDVCNDIVSTCKPTTMWYYTDKESELPTNLLKEIAVWGKFVKLRKFSKLARSTRSSVACS